MMAQLAMLLPHKHEDLSSILRFYDWNNQTNKTKNGTISGKDGVTSDVDTLGLAEQSSLYFARPDPGQWETFSQDVK